MSSPQSLLVVDDSEADREIVALTLSAAFPTAEIRRAADPFHAKELCEERNFDCVLLDYNLPDIDGVSLARELRAAHHYLPLIVMSSVGDEMLVAAALRAGASDYMPKSRLTAESVRRAVDRSINVAEQARVIDEQRNELENFAYALAHDFKQPIRQITTFSQLIADELKCPGGSELAHNLKFLSDAARRLGKLVDVMSQYTLLNQPPELAEVNIAQVLDNTETALTQHLVDTKAVLDWQAPQAWVRGNETLLSQVLQNLIVNGVKYNRSETPTVRIRARQEGDHWVIDVADNGIGIEAEYVTEIFKPLVRLHTAAEYAGTGLGLTLARKAVFAQKGAIWCQSTPGAGSTFHVRLPACAAPAAKRRAKRKAAA